MGILLLSWIIQVCEFYSFGFNRVLVCPFPYSLSPSPSHIHHYCLPITFLLIHIVALSLYVISLA